MAAEAVGTAERLAAARAGSHEALGEALEACRRYLLLVAQRELAPELQAKGGASDLVQQTFLEAQRDFPRFAGTTEAELLAWLRCILLHNLGKFSRQYRGTQKRGLEREVTLDGDSAAGGPGGRLALAQRPRHRARADRRPGAGAGPPAGRLPPGDRPALPRGPLVRGDRRTDAAVRAGRAQAVGPRRRAPERGPGDAA